MKGYKGFHKGMICRGKQYTENTVFEESEAYICKSGMHFCENPFDVLDYYDFMNYNGEFNEFAEVEALDEVKTDDYQKYCTKKLKIGAKLSLIGFVKACVDFVIEKETVAQAIDVIASTGDYSKVASTGHNSKVASTGDYSAVASTGLNSKVASTGHNSKVASTGDYSAVASTGNYSKVASTGDRSKVASTGFNSTVASTGRSSTVVSTGSASTVVSTGCNSTVASTGECCIICCAGIGSHAKAKKGSWITLTEWEWDKEKGRYVPVCVKTEQVDGEHIKENTYYQLVNGEFQEVEA